ncbi:hypothetical protein B296_00022249, partial [Ensete ventricosum]
MGAANSKNEEDKALVLCKERKRFVRRALDERCSLAAAHVSYVQSLRNTGIALRKFVEPEAPAESSLYTSTSATPEAFAFIHKPVSHFSNSSPSLSQHVDTADSFSPVPSPLSTGGLHVNHMKARKTSYMTVKEKLPTSATATQRISSTAPKHLVSGLDETSSSESPSTPSQAQPWDYFGLSHPIDKQLSFQNNRGLSHGFDIADEISCLEEDEGIPELEGEGDIRASTNEKGDMDSEDDFDEPSNEPLASGMIRREYDMKCRLLRHKESISESRISVDKTRAVVKDLHSRIRVAIQRIDSISKKIEAIRDKELQPQLEELIGGYYFFTISSAYEERDSEQDEREIRYSPRGEEAPSGAPTGKKGHRKRLTMAETRLDVLETSVEELYQCLGKLLGVESSQEEAETWIEKVESLIDQLTEDTKDFVRHLHEVVAELTAKVMVLTITLDAGGNNTRAAPPQHFRAPEPQCYGGARDAK